MTVHTFGSDVWRKSAALVTCLVLLAGAVPSVVAQASTGAVTGVILNPDGAPSYGFKVVLRDVASNKTFMSAPTDAQGNYSMQVPLGGQYKVDSVVADDGITKLRVQDVAPISVLTEGTTRLNVRFTSSPVLEEQPAGKSADKDKKKGAVPWYRRPGPIIGIVLGSAAIAAIALSGGGGSSHEASPFTPNP